MVECTLQCYLRGVHMLFNLGAPFIFHIDMNKCSWLGRCDRVLFSAQCIIYCRDRNSFKFVFSYMQFIVSRLTSGATVKKNTMVLFDVLAEEVELRCNFFCPALAVWGRGSPCPPLAVWGARFALSSSSCAEARFALPSSSCVGGEVRLAQL